MLGASGMPAPRHVARRRRAALRRGHPRGRRRRRRLVVVEDCLALARHRRRSARACAPRRRRRRAPRLAHPALARSSSRRGRSTSTARAGSFEAVAQAGVPALVYASSVGAYSRGPKDRLVDESWPTGGVPTCVLLAPQGRGRAPPRRVRARAPRGPRRAPAPRADLPARRGVGDPAPVRRPVPAQPRSSPPMDTDRARAHPRLRFQAVHADDVADAYRRAIVGDARGAFNVAAEPVLDGEALGRLLGARPVPVPARALRARRRRRPSACVSRRRRRAGSTWPSPCRSWTPPRARAPRGRGRAGGDARASAPRTEGVPADCRPARPPSPLQVTPAASRRSPWRCRPAARRASGPPRWRCRPRTARRTARRPCRAPAPPGRSPWPAP